MSAFGRRRPGSRPSFLAGPMIALAVVVSAVVIIAALWAFGLLDLSKLRSSEPSTAGLIAVPTPGRPIPAYTRVTRDHLWDPRRNRLSVVYLPPRAVTKEMLVGLSDVIGRVIGHDKLPGYVFTDDDFLPKGTREGLVAGIPPGKRAIRVPADKVEGVYGLRGGDRFDLVATMPIDASRSSQPFNVSGVYSEQLSVQARLSNWQKQATVRVLVQNGVIVEPMTTRQIPILQSSLTEHSGARMRPVQEVVIAIDPEEVARLTEAMAVEAKISMVPRSGRPDDPVESRTPDLRPVSPFGPPGGGGVSPTRSVESVDGDEQAFSVVETIMGRKRALTAVPRP